AAHEADPSGRWLLPVAAYQSDAEPDTRRVFVDTARWDDVVGDFFAGTSTAALSDQLARFPAAPTDVYATGDSVRATSTADSVSGGRGLKLVFQYVNDAGNLTSADVPLSTTGLPTSGSQVVRFSRPLRDCHAACQVVGLDLAGCPHDTLRLTDVMFGDEQLFG